MSVNKLTQKILTMPDHDKSLICDSVVELCELGNGITQCGFVQNFNIIQEMIHVHSIY